MMKRRDHDMKVRKRDTVNPRAAGSWTKRAGRAMLMPGSRLLLGLHVGIAVLAAAASGVSAAVRVAAEGELAQRLQRLGERVERYYRQAQRLLATETVHIQPIAADLSANGFGRRLVYEFRIEWDETAPGANPEPKALRRLLLVEGRAPKAKDEPKCMDPNAVSDDPLTMLLPANREKFSFALGNDGRVEKRPVKTVEFRVRRPNGYQTPVSTWKQSKDEDCVSIPLEEFVRGRIHIDAESGDVVRLEQHLLGPVDVNPPPSPSIDTAGWRVVERWDQVISYKAVAFSNPDETLMVPTSIDTVVVARGLARVRTTQTYSGYRRFVAESRIVK
jgi:hypothetical protein